MRCSICGSLSWRHLFEACDRMLRVTGVFSEYRCVRCGLIRLSPQPSPRELKRFYPPKKYYSYKHNAKPGFFGKLRSYLVVHGRSPTLESWILGLFIQVPAMPRTQIGKILDIGCGSGDTVALLQSVGWEAYGLDIDAGAVNAAKQRGLQHVVQGTYKDLKKYRDNYFDAIRLYHVIEHLDDPKRCVALAYAKLKKGGELIIGTPNADSIVAKLFRQYWYNLDCPRHFYLFSPANLLMLVQRYPFIHTSVDYASAGGWIGSVQYILEERFGKKIDLINKPLLILLFYPLEWILDLLRRGDIFVIEAYK